MQRPLYTVKLLMKTIIRYSMFKLQLLSYIEEIGMAVSWT